MNQPTAPTQSETSADLAATFAPEPVTTTPPPDPAGPSRTDGGTAGGGEEIQSAATQQVVQGEASKPTFAKEDVAEILRGVLPALQAQPTTAEPSYTPEQLQTMFNVWQPDEALLVEMGLPAEAAPAFVKMRDGLIKQANTYVEARLKLMEDRMEERYGGAAKTVQDQAIAQREAEFYDQNKDLVDHKDVVTLVLADLRQKGVAPKTIAEGAKILADATRALLKSKGVVLPAGDGGSPQTENPPVKMASLSGGSTGAAGRSASSASTGGVAADLKSVFGP